MATADAAVARRTSVDGRVLAEQVKSLYGQLPVSMTGTTLGGLVLVGVLWNHASHALLLGWLGALLVNQAWRLVVLTRFRATRIEAANAERWALWWMIGATISGTLYGVAGALFFSGDSTFHQIAVIVILFVMCAGAVPLLATYPPALFAFLLPALAPLAIRMMTDGEHLFIGVVVAVALVFMVFLGLHYGRVLVESIRIRFENLDLIDQLVKQKREAEDARGLAEAANRSKTQFFAAASHDLRQPLHAMGLFAGALESRVRDPEVVSVVRSINAAVDALDALFSELLDISKIDAGVVRPEPIDFRLQDLFDRVAPELAGAGEAKGLRVVFRRTPAVVRSDPVLLERILRNFVSNAIRYTSAGGVMVVARDRGAAVSLEVWDTGAGIADADRERVFDEFYQVGNPERDRKKGLGLGLAIVQRLATLLESEVTLDSRPGRGSVFRIRVPRATRPMPLPAPAATATPPGSLAGRTVLVIDDEPSVVEGMSALLASWGATAVGASDLADAFARLGDRRPDLAIVDFRLREGATGIDVIGALRARFGGALPAILATGSTTPDLAGEAERAGAALAHKPVPPARLRALVAAQLKAGARGG